MFCKVIRHYSLQSTKGHPLADPRQQPLSAASLSPLCAGGRGRPLAWEAQRGQVYLGEDKFLADISSLALSAAPGAEGEQVLARGGGQSGRFARSYFADSADD